MRKNLKPKVTKLKNLIPKTKDQAPEKEKKIKKTKATKAAKSTKKTKSIMVTLLSSFAVPVILMVILGVVSYRIAYSAVISKCEDSAVSTVEAVGEYWELVTDTISQKALSMVTDGALFEYYSSAYLFDGVDSHLTFADGKASMTNLITTSSLVSGATLISEKATGTSTIPGTLPADAYKGLLQTSEGETVFGTKNSKKFWLGYHTYLDENMTITPKKYAMCFYQKFISVNSVLILDVDMKTFNSVMEQVDFGEGTISALVTPDGREINKLITEEEIDEEEQITYFVGTDFYEASKESEDLFTDRIMIDGKEYIYILAPIGATTVNLCTLIPVENFLGEIETIKLMTIGIVIVSAVVAFLIGLFISMGIGNTVRSMSKGLSHVESGDLTNEFKTKRKDEFKTLSNSMNSMLTSLRGFIGEVKTFSVNVNNMSGEVYERTDGVNIAMNDISTAVSEVAEGIQNQAQEAERSNEKMIALAENINSIVLKTQDMVESADKTIETVDNGKQMASLINDQSQQTVEISKALVSNIHEVQELSLKIRGIVDIINDIAEETNLLSLNASIEAARAGEAGRGFAVVAEEIRKLANQSNDSGLMIKEIVDSIAETSDRTADSVREAETLMTNQADSLIDTVESFANIEASVRGLVSDIHGIKNKMQEMLDEKNVVQDSISNISAVSEEVSAATEEVTATLVTQVEIMNGLLTQVTTLKEDIDTLNTSMGRFII